MDALHGSTVSSREIAELCEKRHDNVMRDIREMFDRLKIEEVGFAGTYKDLKGEVRDCFNLPKRETLILVSGYKVELRARIIDRWQELEACISLLSAFCVRHFLSGLPVKPALDETKRGAASINGKLAHAGVHKSHQALQFTILVFSELFQIEFSRTGRFLLFHSARSFPA